MRRALPFLALSASLLAAPASGAERPFDPGLTRLAEVLGSLHFLTTLCGGDATWRREMETLLDAEQPDDARRTRFVSGFNRGYQAFATNYGRCTPAANAAIGLYVEEGQELSRGLTNRFGN